MKKWNNPELEVVGVEDTEYGASTITKPDKVLKDKETGEYYEGFEPSGN